jgi:hypothetical protein
MKSNRFIKIISRDIVTRGSVVAIGNDETLYIVAHVNQGFVFVHKLRGSKKIIKLPLDSVKILIL